MFGSTWLAYFEGNARRDRAPGAALFAEVPAALRTPVAESLARFQLGESAGGRIHEEIVTLPDRSLDAATRRSIQLYIEEEWRHARELSTIICALGGRLLEAHWTNGAFTACRRVLGLRTKMMTLAIAEVVGIVYYRALAAGVGSPALAASLQRIANEEARHLDFQAEFFDQAIRCRPAWFRPTYRLLLRALMSAIFGAALVVLLLDHRRVLCLLGVKPLAVVSGGWRELHARAFLKRGRELENRTRRPVAARSEPRYALTHERGA